MHPVDTLVGKHRHVPDMYQRHHLGPRVGFGTRVSVRDGSASVPFSDVAGTPR